MKQFRTGDTVRRIGPTQGGVRKGWLYKVIDTHSLDALILEGTPGETVYDMNQFQLEPGLRPGIVEGGFVRRFGTSRNEVLSGGVYQVERINDFSLSLVGLKGTYSFARFEPVTWARAA